MSACRKVNLIPILMLVLQIGVYGQCPLGGKYLCTSQAECDSFSFLYPNCTALEELLLEGGEIINLQGFDALDNVDHLEMVNLTLDSIFLDFTISSTLLVSECNTLQNLDLSFEPNLKKVDVSYCDQLHSLDLSDLRQVESIISYNDSIDIKVDTLTVENLLFGGDVMLINDVPTKIDDKLDLRACRRYESFTKIFQDFQYQFIKVFRLISIPRFSSVGNLPSRSYSESFTLALIDTLITDGFEGVSFSAGSFTLSNIDDVEDLTMFSEGKIKKLHVNGLDNIVSLDGMQETAARMTLLDIGNTPKLIDISAISNLGSSSTGVTWVHIMGAPLLTYCHYAPICDIVETAGNTPNVVIEQNAGDCIDEPTLLEACITSTDEQDNTNVTFGPNPVIDRLSASASVVPIAIYDFSGKVVHHWTGAHQNEIDLHDLPAGVYVLTYHIPASDEFFHYRFLKQ